MVELLLSKGAVNVETKLGDTPVDMAGFCGEIDTVLVFCRDLKKRIDDGLYGPNGAGLVSNEADIESQTKVSPA